MKVSGQAPGINSSSFILHPLLLRVLITAPRSLSERARPAARPPARPPIPGRSAHAELQSPPLLTFLFAVALTLTDLQGNWMNSSYADALVKTRSPLQAERLGTPLSMTIRGDRAEMTTYHEGSWRRIISVGKGNVVVSPLEDPNGKPETLPLAGNRNRIYVELWPHTRVTYRRLDVDPESYARRVVLAGTYTDTKGVQYVFGETAEPRLVSAPAAKHHAPRDTSEA